MLGRRPGCKNGVLDQVRRERFVVPAGESPVPTKVVPAGSLFEARHETLE